MSKLTGPLLSFGARGQIGKAMVISEWKGIKYARQYVTPSNPQTAEQTITRSTFSLINALWLIAPALFRAPWTANAIGQKYTNRNKLIKENLPALRDQLNMQNFIASPGALGGPPLEGFTPSAGAGAGTIDIVVSTPTIPTGWTLASVTAVAFPDQDPAAAFGGPVVSATDATAPYEPDLAGLPAATLCVVSVFPVWTRPDGRTAYGASLVATATTGA